MKAITIRQPWASLIAAGVKTVETRPRSTSYRGRIAIHAAKADTDRFMHRYPEAWTALGDVIGGDAPPRGAVVASAVLTDCVPVDQLINEPTCQPAEPWGAGHYIVDLDRERPLGDFSSGRWALLLDDIAPATERCPWCWDGAIYPECPAGCGCRGWADADRRDCACDGPCCFADQLTDYPGVRWDDRYCNVCENAGRCDPVPARGQQAVPWEWQA